MDVYLKNVASRWKKEAINAESLIILSPYISSPTADELIKNIDCYNCKIYTLFSPYLFANKSSSIDTLIILKRKGCSIYYLKSLHAKIVLIPEKIASIGSQNLTQSGESNKEATVIITDKEKLSEIQQQISQWTSDSQELTLDMLKDMKSSIKEIASIYEKLSRLSSKTNKDILEKEKNRKAKNTKTERRKVLFSNVLTIKRDLNKSIGVIRHIEPEYYQSKDLYTLKLKDSSQSFLHWVVEGKTHNLIKTMRYLIISEDSGYIGWARVNRTQISFIERSLSITKDFMLNRQTCELNINFIWNQESNSNLILIIKPQNATASIKCNCWFDLRRIHINDIKPVSEEINGDITLQSLLSRSGSTQTVTYKQCKACDVSKRMINWTINNNDIFSRKVIPILLNSFDYKDKLTGMEALFFFGSTGACSSIQLGLIQGYPLLITKRV